MNSARIKFSCAFALLLLLASAGGHAFAIDADPSAAQGVDRVMQKADFGQRIQLLFDPGVSTLRVPPPPELELQDKGLMEKAATVTVNYLPAGSRLGNDTCIAWPDQARAAFTFAANVWASQVQSAVPIVVDACWANNMDAGVLGAAGPGNLLRDFPGAPVANTWYSVALANALSGSDLEPGQADVVASFNSTFNWYFGIDGRTPASQQDFASVVLHEIGHGLGFSGSMRVASGAGMWGDGSGFPFIYDRFTENAAGQQLINTAVFANPSAALAAQLQSNAVFFNGTNANAGNGGARVPLYAPSTFVAGSSYSHLAESFNNTPNALMTFALASGESLHSPGPVTMGLFRDIGWPLSTPGGSFTLTVARSGTGSGTITSSPAGINCGSTCSANFNAGTVVTLTASAATGSTFGGWSGAGCSGTGACVVTMSTANAVTVTFNSTTSSASRLSNLSTRGQVQTGDNVMIGGFIVGGTAPKKVLIRARGPSLTAFGVAGALSDPVLQLYSGQTVITSNDNWPGASNSAEIQASGLAPTNARESAILRTLNPGAYTAIVSGFNGATGVGIVEAFEIDRPDVPLTNLSTRGRVLTGDNVMIGGFVITGTSPRTLLITARGPSLTAFGVSGALPDPTLSLYSGQTRIASNDDWGGASNAAAIQATGRAPTNSLESAILVTLNPGAYTAIVSGLGGGTGVGIVEVFAQ